MKKKQRCFVKRFAALVAALMLCSSLCLPAFASNNASTKKWVVADEDMRRGESGQLTRYLKVTPYVGGAQYATIITSDVRLQKPDADHYDRWILPLNYPDWWRASLPLGYTAYVELSSPRIIQAYYTTTAGDYYTSTNVCLIPLHKRYALNSTFSRYSSATSFTGSFFAFPLTFYNGNSDTQSLSVSDGIVLPASGETSIKALNSIRNLVPSVSSVPSQGFAYYPTTVFANASSSDIIWTVVPAEVFSNKNRDYARAEVSVVISYWIGADKLPAGLQIGDEFPADSDAFDQLRDDLIEQFPEASDYIENGKSTMTDWNDTETVDTDVASTSISALNAMFQNLGEFLFIVSLMVFGAVVLRMFIKKAVDG